MTDSQLADGSGPTGPTAHVSGLRVVGVMGTEERRRERRGIQAISQAEGESEPSRTPPLGLIDVA